MSESKGVKLGSSAAASTTGVVMSSPSHVTASVAEYYGKTLTSTVDLKTTACTAAAAPAPYIAAAIARVPAAVLERFYGCGHDIVEEGLEGSGATVVDLGCGSGRDVYVAAQVVGSKGKVIGIDMTAEQLGVARAAQAEFAAANPNAAKIEFVQGFIEKLDDVLQPGSVDLVISNCVVNLSPNKKLVLEGVYRALRDGGEKRFSDVFCDRRLPEAVRKHDVLVGECLGGAIYVNDFLHLARSIGFEPRELSRAPIVVDGELAELLGSAKFWSITYRLFKIKNPEVLCEDYGQIAYMTKKIKGSEFAYQLDDHHVFELGRPVLVCGNTSQILEQSSWLSKHFKVIGPFGGPSNRDQHFGEFPCGAPSVSVAAAATKSSASSSSGSCTGGSCSGGGCSGGAATAAKSSCC